MGLRRRPRPSQPHWRSSSAEVPAALARNTGKFGRALLDGQLAEKGAAQLAADVLKEMTLAKHKMLAAIALLVLVAGIGVGLVACFVGDQAGGPLAPAPHAAPADRKDRHGDLLPEGAVARIGSARFWADCLWVDALHFASGGKRVVTFARDGKVRLWDGDTGKEIRAFDGGSVLTPLPGVVCRAPISLDGQRFAFVGSKGPKPDGIIHVHECDAGVEVGQIKVGEDVQPLAFSPDGKVLAVTGFPSNRKIVLHAVTGGKVLGQLGDDRTVFCCAAFSPDGKKLAAAEIDKTITIWDVATGQALHRLVGHAGQPLDFMLDVAFRGDGETLVSVSADRTVRTWNVATGKEIDRFVVGPGVRASFSRTGSHVAVVGRDNGVEVWDVAGRKKLRAWLGRAPQHGRSDTDGFLATGFSLDRQLLALGNGPRLQLYSLATGDELYPGHSGEVRAVALTPDGRETATDSSDGATGLWESGTGKQLVRIECDRMSNFMVTRRIAFTEDGKELVLTDRDRVRYLHASTGREKHRVGLRDETSRGPLALSADGRFLLGVGLGGRSWVLDSRTGQMVCRLTDNNDRTGPWGNLHFAAFSPDRERVAVAYSWGLPEARLAEHRNAQVVKVWDMATGKVLVRFDSGGPLAFTPDGKTLATVGDATPLGLDEQKDRPTKVRLWDVSTGKELRQVVTTSAFAPEGLPLAFSPDGKLLATAGAGGKVCLWDTTTGKTTAELTGAQGRVTALAFSADGKLLASGGADTTVLLWKMPASER